MLTYKISYQHTFLVGLLFLLTACGGGSATQLPQTPPLPISITDIASYANTTCSIRAQDESRAGSIWCWGSNASFRMGDPAKIGKNVLKPLQIDAHANWISVSVGFHHICAVNETGGLYCRGRNSSGNIGVAVNPVASDNIYYDFIRVGQANDWQSVAITETHSCAIKTDGGLFCWGSNNAYQLASGTNAQIETPTAILKSRAIQDNSEWLKISTSSSFTCGIKNEINSNNQQIKSAWCWGWSNALGNGIFNNDPILYPLPVILPASKTNSSWIDISAGTNHACGIIEFNNSTSAVSSGSLWCWGGNIEGQSGQDNTIMRTLLVPTQVRTAENWVKVSAGFYHTCAVNTRNRLFCWGRNANVQLGALGNDSIFTPTLVGNSNEQGWISVASDRTHDCAVKQSLNTENKNQSDVWCWGRNLNGQLGNNTINLTTIPNKVINNKAINDTPNVWAQLDTGNRHSCAIKTDGTLWCWGLNSDGQLGDKTTISNLAIKQESNLYNNWLQVSSYGRHSCALRSIANSTGNSLWCWGTNFSGQLGGEIQTPGIPANVPPLLAIPTQEASLAVNWKKLSVGNGFSCALKLDDTYWCWGDNAFGKLTQEPADLTRPFDDEQRQAIAINIANNTATKWSSVSSGNDSQCGITLNNNFLYCWGENNYEQLGSKSIAKLGSAELYSATLLQVNPIGVTNSTWVSVSMGRRHACAIDFNQSLWCWGSTNNGAIGDPTVYDPLITKSISLRQISTPADSQSGIITVWKLISVHDNMSCALKLDNSLWCWGSNNNGEIGAGNKTLSPVPIQEATQSTNWKIVSASDNHTCALKLDNSLWCWGDNGDGELGNGNAFVTVPVRALFP